MDTDVTLTNWQLPLANWLAWLAAGGMPSTSLDLRTYQMRRFARSHRDLRPFALDTNDLARWLASYVWARETLRSYRSALRSFYGWAQASGLTDSDPARLLRKVPPSQPKPRPASERIVTDALASSTDRLWLMLMLGSRHGLRRGEISRVHTADLIDHDDGTWSLLVHGKGEKERVVPLSDDLCRVLTVFPIGWVFPNGRGWHLTPAHCGKLISGALADGVTPHQLRHRFASRAYQATGDIRAVQELLGHASVATTQIYTAVADGALRRVLNTAA